MQTFQTKPTKENALKPIKSTETHTNPFLQKFTTCYKLDLSKQLPLNYPPHLTFKINMQHERDPKLRAKSMSNSKLMLSLTQLSPRLSQISKSDLLDPLRVHSNIPEADKWTRRLKCFSWSLSKNLHFDVNFRVWDLGATLVWRTMWLAWTGCELKLSSKIIKRQINAT